MRHLYQQIFATIVLVAVVCGAAAVLAARLFDPTDRLPPVVVETARYLAADLPQQPHAMQRELRRRGRRAHVPLALWSADGRLLARHGPKLPEPDFASDVAYSFSGRRHIGLVLPLDDGRRLVVGHRHRPRQPGGMRLVLALVLLLAFLLLGSYWAARRITRRLELLGQGAQRLGSGGGPVQVQVEGRDEVAALAERFNTASERIDALLAQQARLLAGASHELRSPLARLRMALELLGGDALQPARRHTLLEECARDIAELDVLIDDILLGARLRDAQAERRFVEVQLDALLASEAERVGAEASLTPIRMRGDARALRSLARNLLENAQRYGAPPLRVRIARGERGRVRIVVEDAGTPIAEAERERIFEPFFRPAGSPEGQGGAGLGLSLVRDIARHHGGDVHYEVSAAGGSVFVVDLADA